VRERVGKGNEGLDVDICPGAPPPEFLVTPVSCLAPPGERIANDAQRPTSRDYSTYSDSAVISFHVYASCQRRNATIRHHPSLS